MANEQTSAKVAGLATQPNAVNRSNLSLLGVYGPENSMSALIRLPSGRTREVKRGTKLSQGQIIAIDAHGLVLNQRGETKRLVMPGS